MTHAHDPLFKPLAATVTAGPTYGNWLNRINAACDAIGITPRELSPTRRAIEAIERLLAREKALSEYAELEETWDRDHGTMSGDAVASLRHSIGCRDDQTIAGGLSVIRRAALAVGVKHG